MFQIYRKLEEPRLGIEGFITRSLFRKKVKNLKQVSYLSALLPFYLTIEKTKFTSKSVAVTTAVL